MKSFLALAVCLLSLTSANPLHTRQSTTWIPTVGLSSPYPRQPIQTLHAENPDVWNMYILAMESIQAVPESDPLSWYQIAGIHGRPYAGWGGEVTPSPAPQYGYCEHGSITFGTWHRPYLSLLEQELVKHAVAIAANFTGADKAKYQAAAEQVRLPYWDTADLGIVEEGFPAELKDAELTITKPTGEATIPNPLSAYRFQSEFYEQRMIDFEKAKQPAIYLQNVTSRVPFTFLNEAAQVSRRRRSLYNLVSITSFNRFCTSAYSDAETDSTFSALEIVHSEIHGAINGWMGSVEVAGFDPVFWMHHANVDRQMALWQAMHPASLEGERATLLPANVETQPTFGMPTVHYEDVDTPLQPFRLEDGTEWTSHDAQDLASIFKYGYSYPELDPAFTTKDAAEVRSEVIAEWTRHYYDEVVLSEDRKRATPVDTELLEWTAVIDFDPTPGLVNVILSVDGVDVGVATAFSNRGVGTVPLGAVLEGKVDSQDAKATEAYLKKELSWRSVGGDAPGLTVEVKAGKVLHYGSGRKAPKVGKFTKYKSITEGKKGSKASN